MKTKKKRGDENKPLSSELIELLLKWQEPLQPEQLPVQESSSLCWLLNLAKRTFFTVNEPKNTNTAKAMR